MNLPTEVFGSVIVVHSPDELSRDHAGAFESFVTHLDRNNVVLDLNGTETLDSAGLESLVTCARKLRELEGDVKISTSSPTNRKMLEITRLDEQLEVYDSVIDAVKSFN